MQVAAQQEVKVFAPASVANLGPGFDVLGLALLAPGDTVTARLTGGSGVSIAAIRGDDTLPFDPERNVAAIAAAATLSKTGVQAGIELEIDKGLPTGAGLGSSEASAVAAAFAVNLLLGSPLRKVELVEPCLQAEETVSGRHLDSICPALLGGLILVRSMQPLDLVRLPIPADLTVAVAVPRFELPGSLSRDHLPKNVPLDALVRHTANLAALVSACHSDDLALLGRSILDDLVTSSRADLIPGCRQVMEASLDAGALGSAICGSGPSIFALCRSERSAREVALAMAAAFKRAGLESGSIISRGDCPGARGI